jgi:hypothetical protein
MLTPTIFTVSVFSMRASESMDLLEGGNRVPNGFDIDQLRASLGFKVITGLVRQLQGHLKFVSNNPKGTHSSSTCPSCRKPRNSNSGRYLAEVRSRQGS